MSQKPTEDKAQKSNILSFEQKSDFFYKRGMSKLDKKDYFSALASYRTALEKEPEDDEVRFALASLYGEMERFSDSNMVLAPMLEKGRPDPEFFFAMGCNYAGLNMAKYAKESLELYLQLEPNGEFSYDACDMLDALDDFVDDDGIPLPPAPMTPLEQAGELCEKGRILLTKNDNKQAIATFKKALSLYPDHTQSKNFLSYTYFYIGEQKKSLEYADEVLVKEPENVQALCQKALIYNAAGDDDLANDIANRLYGMSISDFDDLARVSLIMMQLERHEQAYEYSQKLAALAPYDQDVLYQLGICACNIKNYKVAAQTFGKLCILDPTDTIARYYQSIFLAAQRSGKAKPVVFPAMYQVPLDEMVARITKANALVKLTQNDLVQSWQESDSLEQLTNWVLTIKDDDLSWSMLMLISSFNDERSTKFLRDFLLRPEQSDKLKQFVIGLLATAGAKQPFIVCIDGRYVPVSANPVKKRVPIRYREIIVLCIKKMTDRCTNDCVTAAGNIWREYIYALDTQNLPPLTKDQSVAMAAAIERTAHQRLGEEFDDDELIAIYGITKQRLENALKKMAVMERIKVEKL